jgi:hypothetical protein
MRILVLALLALAVASAAENDWSDVQKLRSGKRIGVIHGNMQRAEGNLTAVTDSTVSVDGTAIQKDQVVRVYTIGRTNRLTRTLIGAGIGLAAGVILNATAGERFRNEGSDQAAGIIGGSVAAGAGIGALTGSGHTTVYRRTRP